MDKFRLIKEFSKELTSTLDIKEVAKVINRFSVVELGAEKSSIVLTSGVKYCHSNLRRNIFDSIESELFKYIARVQKKIIISNPSSEYMFKNMNGISDFNLSIVSIPLFTKKKLIGSLNLYFNLKPMEEIYDFLELFAELSSSSILNSLTYKNLEEESLTDGLTSLYNRRCFDREIKCMIEKSFNLKKPISLMMIDIDNFKKFNDNYGHQKGDKILSEIGVIVSNSVNGIGKAFRYGGEELVVLIQDKNSNESIEESEKIRLKIMENCQTTVSIGVVTCVNSSCSASEMIKEADIALYNAKNSGKNRVSALLILDKALGSIDVQNASQLGKKRESLS